MFKDIAYLCSLSLQVKRRRVGLTDMAKTLEVGFASGQPENSPHEKASLESLKDTKRSCKKSHEEKEVSNVMFMAEFFPNFKSWCQH